MIAKLNNRYACLFYLSLFFMAASLVTRVVLYLAFGLNNDIPLLHLPLILGLGAVNDYIELFYILLPFSLYIWLMPHKWFSNRWHLWILSGLTFAVLVGFIYVCCSEYFFFEEFSARFNLVAVSYLIYPTEVFTNIFEAYPVVKALIFCVLTASVLMYFFWGKIRESAVNSVSFKKRSGIFAGHLAIFAALFLGLHTHSFDYSNNRISNELVANGVSSFFEAFHTNNLDYDAYYATDDSKAMFDLLRQNLQQGTGKFTSEQSQNLQRQHVATAKGLGKINVVVLLEESFGARFSASYQTKLDLTPNFDRLAKQGILFKHAYATGTRTVRGIEAIITSLPPIPSESTVKRPGCENIANWGEVLKQHGYSSNFVYGGFGAFDNMNYFFRNNGFTIRDRTDFENVTFSNIWGVCDEDLFAYSINYFNTLAKSGQPFFAIVLSTSNHKPFTFPEGIKDIPAKDGGRYAGVRYADYAIGKFFEKAQQQAWFNNTIFIIVADHDARVYGAAKFPIYSYKIPLLIYAPKHIKPQLITTRISQLDIAPTVMGLLGLNYKAPFYGQDVLHWPSSKTRTILMNHNHDVALMQGDTVAVLSLLKKTQTYTYDDQHEKLTPTAENKDLQQLAKAYYQTAYELFRKHLYTLRK